MVLLEAGDRVVMVSGAARGILYSLIETLGVGQAGRGVVGRSLVVGPDGVVGLEFDELPNIRTVDIDGDALLEVRLQNPSLANRRYRVLPV